jgi:hypothetical protein
MGACTPDLYGLHVSLRQPANLLIYGVFTMAAKRNTGN